MSFYIRDMNQVDENALNIPVKGKHDVTVMRWQAATNKNSGKDQLVLDMLIDAGESAGQTVPDWLVWGQKGFRTGKTPEQVVKIICVANAYVWKPATNFKDFLQQFPDGQFRAGIVIDHEYRIKKPGAAEMETVSEEIYNRCEVGTHVEKKEVRPVITDYTAPSGEREITLPSPEDEAYAQDGTTVAAGSPEMPWDSF